VADFQRGLFEMAIKSGHEGGRYLSIDLLGSAVVAHPRCRAIPTQHLTVPYNKGVGLVSRQVKVPRCYTLTSVSLGQVDYKYTRRNVFGMQTQVLLAQRVLPCPLALRVCTVGPRVHHWTSCSPNRTDFYLGNYFTNFRHTGTGGGTRNTKQVDFEIC
jgi:hypothetical protein